MEVSNASVYDGASGLAEAILMAVRANKTNKSGKVLYAESLNPDYLSTVRTIVSSQGIELEALTIGNQGLVATDDAGDMEPAAVVIQHPNFFGRLELVDQITDWAHSRGALVIAVVTPISLGILKPPGEWGAEGVDIACGAGHPLGVPMSSGGPSFGYICCKKKYVRQIPGRS
jgi:glycine dehydrogenase (decarboxylating) alpha subunit (EC 1.4.4.2)